MSRLFDGDHSIAIWLKHHGSKQLLLKSCVANTLMHLAIHEYNKAQHIPADALAELQVIVELDIYDKIADRESYLANPEALLGFVDDHFGGITILEPSAAHESVVPLFDLLRGAGLPIIAMVPPGGSQCYVTIMKDHATLTYNDGEQLVSFDPGRVSSPGKGLVKVKKMEDLTGLTSRITFDTGKLHDYINSIRAAFAARPVDFLEDKFSSLNLKHELYSHGLTHRLIKAFKQSEGSPAITHYLVHSYMQRNHVLKFYYDGVTESVCPDGKPSEQLLAKGPINLDALDNPPFTDDPHEEANPDYRGYIIIMQHVNPVETRRVTQQLLEQARLDNARDDLSKQSVFGYAASASQLILALGEEYNDLKNEALAFIFSDSVFFKLADTMHGLSMFSKLASKETYSAIIQAKLESTLKPANIKYYIELPSDLYKYLQVAKQHNRIDLIEAVLDQEYIADSIQSESSSRPELSVFADTTELLQSIDPVLAEKYSRFVTTLGVTAEEAESKLEV